MNAPRLLAQCHLRGSDLQHTAIWQYLDSDDEMRTFLSRSVMWNSLTLSLRDIIIIIIIIISFFIERH